LGFFPYTGKLPKNHRSTSWYLLRKIVAQIFVEWSTFLSAPPRRWTPDFVPVRQRYDDPYNRRHIQEMFDADVSPTLISKSTDAVKEQMTEWQSRSLNALCLIVYPDCIVVKVRHGVSVVNKAVFLALSSNTEGQNELLGMWLAENEGAKFWLSVLTELKNRDLQDILIACVDGIQFSRMR
jgi:hypothetical protein